MDRAKVFAGLLTFFLVPIFGLTGLRAQQSTTTTTNPAAASGMTTGLPGVSPRRQAEMMHVRARAQAARPEAERAAMERSAEQALARKTESQILEDARETRRLKQQASREIQYQKAANAYRGVGAREINSWPDRSGRVRVESGVPPEVLAALPPDEEEEMEKEGGFHPFRMTKKAARGAVGVMKKGVSWIPGVGRKDDEAEYESSAPAPPPPAQAAAPHYSDATPYVGDAPAESEPKKGFLRRIPLVGGLMKPKDDDGDDGGGDYVEPTATAQTWQGAPPDTAMEEEEKTGFFRGMASKIPFVGGRNKADDDVEMADAGSSAAPIVGPVGSTAPIGPAQTDPVGGSGGEFDSGSTAVGGGEIPGGEEKRGFGGKLKNMMAKVVPGGKNRGGNTVASGSGSIDASLFPQEGDSGDQMADPSAGRHRFFKKKSDLADLPGVAASTPKPPKPKPVKPKKNRSPVHSGGSAVYVVQTNGAQFMRFSGGPVGSESQTLQAGTRVTMTKVGDDWSSIQLSNGSSGIIRNKDLRPATGQSGGVAAASRPPSNNGGLATTSDGRARITSPVSATGAGVSDVPGPPVSIPTSKLTGGGSSTGSGTSTGTVE